MGLVGEFWLLKTRYKFEVIFRKRLRTRVKQFGVCADCNRPNTGYAWCNQCDPGKFLKVVKEGKASGNSEIDNLIHETQVETESYDRNLEWIPYDRLQDIKPIGEGGFANIHSATWLDGEPILADRRKERTGPVTVALKKLKPPNNDNMETFINEVKVHCECDNDSFNFFTRFYGITKDPETEEFMMVLEYASHGNLRDYLKNKFSTLKWSYKLDFLEHIANNISTIHEQQFVHENLHGGNILKFKHDYAKITDFGLSQLYNSESSNSSDICGVLPYMAPENLIGKPHTFASDTYSFGIIMVEMTTGRPPYGNVPHDEKLALAICNGLRPRVVKGTPQCYIDLVNLCLDADPRKRPSTMELCHKIGKLDTNSKEFIESDKINSQESSPEIEINPKAIYTSRLMNFTDLPKPINSTKVQIEDSEVHDSELIDKHASGEFRKSYVENEKH